MRPTVHEGSPDSVPSHVELAKLPPGKKLKSSVLTLHSHFRPIRSPVKGLFNGLQKALGFFRAFKRPLNAPLKAFKMQKKKRKKKKKKQKKKKKNTKKKKKKKEKRNTLYVTILASTALRYGLRLLTHGRIKLP